MLQQISVLVPPPSFLGNWHRPRQFYFFCWLNKRNTLKTNSFWSSFGLLRIHVSTLFLHLLHASFFDNYLLAVWTSTVVVVHMWKLKHFRSFTSSSGSIKKQAADFMAWTKYCQPHSHNTNYNYEKDSEINDMATHYSYFDIYFEVK